MNTAIRNGSAVVWTTNGEYANEVSRARSCYGDGPFTVDKIIGGVTELNPNWDQYATLNDASGDAVIRDKGHSAMFETYLLQKA